ncbi:filamentous hemagglutinin-like protein [uncultured Mediterranean phage uvMED]|nr:filamentous hemagglutinin-like protein [uncultured Mediterranean phage uvMED]
MAITKILSASLASGVGSIAMVDQFRLTSNLTADANPITSNLERVDDASFSQIGTGMTLSSGIYTFPTTGLFQVSVNATFQISQDVNADVETYVSSDSGSNYDQVALARGGEQSSSFSNFSSSSQCFVNVSNASTFRVKFILSGVASTDTRLQGNTNRNSTAFTFIRLGDNQ